MFHVSSNPAVIGGAGVRQPSGSLAMRPHASQNWWRSLWSRRGGRFAEIRRLMLAQLGALADESVRSTLAARIAAADHPEALWALRQDLMSALVEVHGEMLARRRLTDITFMFAGQLRRQEPMAMDMEDADWPAAHMRTDH